MKNYILILVFFVFSIINAQENNIDHLSDENKELLQRLNSEELKRIDRIRLFLKANPEIKNSKSSNGKYFVLYDIIEGKPIYKSNDNLDAAKATKTTHLQPGGSLGLNLDGSGITVGVWDGGPVELTHPEFSNSSNTASRVTIIDNGIVDNSSGTYSVHATHVAGTIAAKGVNASATGMAQNVSIESYNWNNDEAQMVTAVNDIVSPIIISNHSYGVPINQGGGSLLDAWYMGAYSVDARDIDEIAHNNPNYLIVASAGNSGTQIYSGGLFNGYDKLTTDKNAKNNLVIANANPTLNIFTGELIGLVINNSSSQGPTDDLRIKPDIAADGTNVLSSIPTNSYASFNGTSMASPNTSGSLVLLQQYYNQQHNTFMKSSTLKGLVCHTATDDTATTGPDPIFGWGFLDAKAAVEVIIDDLDQTALIEELNLTNSETYTYTFQAQAGDNLVATICWTDLPGSSVNGSMFLNDQTPRLVNDLDLRISKDGIDYFPWRLDYNSSTGFSNSKGDNIRDNVEKVVIEAPESGIYTLTVTHKGILEGNVGGIFDPQTQDFSLIITGNNLTLNVDAIQIADNIRIWPNPANNIINLSFSRPINVDAEIAIIDLRGCTVYSNVIHNAIRINQKNTIDVSNIASGSYILKIKQGNSVYNHKIIIQ